VFKVPKVLWGLFPPHLLPPPSPSTSSPTSYLLPPTSYLLPHPYPSPGPPGQSTPKPTPTRTLTLTPTHTLTHTLTLTPTHTLPPPTSYLPPPTSYPSPTLQSADPVTELRACGARPSIQPSFNGSYPSPTPPRRWVVTHSLAEFNFHDHRPAVNMN